VEHFELVVRLQNEHPVAATYGLVLTFGAVILMQVNLTACDSMDGRAKRGSNLSEFDIAPEVFYE